MLKPKRKTIHLYCPKEHEASVTSVLQKYEINFTINSFDFQTNRGDVVCHYRSYDLSHEQKKILIEATEKGAWVEPLTSYLDRELGFTEIKLVDSSFFLYQKAFSILNSASSKFIKRSFDLILASIAIIMLLPLFILTALAIKLDSRGPVLFKQARTGLFNKEFKVIKFRSMTTDAEKDGAQWATKNDARVTRVGKFIRKTRIDELPQLLNVIKGEMSLIGPRPEREVFIQDLEKSIPYYRFRHSVRPGITGLAQVKYPYGASIEDAEWKHRYDLYYIKHQSFWVDVKITLLTIQTVIFAKGL
ncbi:sugar transferase [Aliidiomarina quisquiliarum]|uniref:sugar transferase n=1 Tax=Aliidiomarina quisquiliarum TaxID=2938947 RepID=UPI00208DF5F8|nr:sugar transferase [Aliidiomarina quisquiliarum]MCO4322411.1 sugar transferase [Aliidiomarina quisquiliarum]